MREMPGEPPGDRGHVKEVSCWGASHPLFHRPWRKMCNSVPSPEWFFQALYTGHGGDFKVSVALSSFGPSLHTEPPETMHFLGRWGPGCSWPFLRGHKSVELALPANSPPTHTWRARAHFLD